MLILSACNSSSSSNDISLEEEFTDYKHKVLEPSLQSSLKTAEMSGRFTNMLQQPQEAYDYLNEELIPFLNEAKELPVNHQENIVNEEIKELNDVVIKQFDLSIQTYSMTADMTKLNIPPVSDEEYQETEKIYSEIQELHKEIDQTTAEYNAKLAEFEEQ